MKKNPKRISNDLINGLPTQKGDEIIKQNIQEEDPDAMEVNENLDNNDFNETTNVDLNLMKPGRKKIFKDMRRGANTTLMNALNAELVALNDCFLEITTPSLNEPSAYVDYGDKTPNPDDFIEGLENYEQQWSDLYLRRVGVIYFIYGI